VKTPVIPASRQGLSRRRVASAGISAAMLAVLGGCSNSGAGPQTVEGMSPDATIDLHELQAAYLANANGGYGTLFFQGIAYPFNVGGGGIGGIGASSVDGNGEVYGLTSLSDFPGSYAQGSYGFAFGNRSAGDLWLKNENGVVLHLHAKRTGLMLSLGGDVIVITMK
jgi:hypothetical protein